MEDKDEGFTLDEWQATAPATFDLKAEYMAQIEPMVQALGAKCQELGIPMLFIANYVQNEKGFVQAERFNLPRDLGKITPGLLSAMHAAQGDLAGLDAVLQANQMRGILAGITKH